MPFAEISQKRDVRARPFIFAYAAGLNWLNLLFVGRETRRDLQTSFFPPMGGTKRMTNE